MWPESLAHPAVLLAVPFVALLGAGALHARCRRPGVAVALGHDRGLAPTQRARLAAVPLFLRLAALVALLVSLAGPEAPMLKRVSPLSRDLVVLLDVSDSMLAEDVLPSRFEAARSSIDAFIGRRPGDRIGLILFAGEAFTQCPLTLDHERLRALLRDARPGVLGPGTAVSATMRLGLQRLRAGSANGRALLLLTDGADTGGPPRVLDAAQEAARAGVRVDVVGFGSSGTAPFTVAGTTVMAEAPGDESLLRAVTRIAGGRFYRGADELQLQLAFREMEEANPSTASAPGQVDVWVFSRRWALAAMTLVLLEVASAATVFRVLP